MKIADGAGHDLPWDGVAFGNLLVRGPRVTAGYLNGERVTSWLMKKIGLTPAMSFLSKNIAAYGVRQHLKDDFTQ